MAANDLFGMTEETFNFIKSQTTGITANTGVYGVDLQPFVSLVPCDTPFRNSTARVSAPQGAPYAYWRSLLNINTSQPNPGVQNDYAAPVTLVDEQDVFAPFQVIAAGGTVTQDAADEAKNYADLYATMTIQALIQAMIGDDIYQLNGLAFALPTISTPTLTHSTTGGTIASGTTVYVKCQARSGLNYYYGGSGVASSEASTTCGTTTSTNSVTAKVAAVKLANAYDWFVGSSGGAEVYYTTTTVNTVTITSVPTVAQPLPNLPLLWNTVPTIATADTSYLSFATNGIQATILGDFGASNYVTPGSGTSQGAYYSSLDGANLTLSGSGVTELDNLNLGIYNNYQISPTRYLLNAAQMNEVADLILGSPQASTYVTTDAANRTGITAGGHVGGYVNRTTGSDIVQFEVQPHLPPGVIVAVCDRVPFQGANIDVVTSVETQRDYARFDYGVNRVLNTAGGGPRQDFEIRTRLAFRNKAGAVMGVLANVA